MILRTSQRAGNIQIHLLSILKTLEYITIKATLKKEEENPDNLSEAEFLPVCIHPGTVSVYVGGILHVCVLNSMCIFEEYKIVVQ